MGKSTITKLLYVGSFLVVSFAGYFGVAHAVGGYAISQFLNDTRTNNTTALGTAISGGIASYGQLLGTQIVGTAATTTVMITDSGGLGPITPAITLECYDDSTYGSSAFNAGCSAQYGLPAENVGNISAKNLVSVSTPFTFQRTKYYRLGLGCTAGCSGGTNPNLIAWGSNITVPDPYYQGYFNLKFTTSTPTLSLTDMYFDITSNTAFGLSNLGITSAMTATSTSQVLQTGAFSNCFSAETSASSTTGFWGRIAGDFGCVLFKPADASLNYISESFTNLQSVFPFSIFFGTANIVEEAIATYDDSGQTLVLGTTFPNADLTNDTSNTITILNPTMVEDRFGSTVTNWWYNIILMLATVLLAWGIFKVIYHPH